MGRSATHVVITGLGPVCGLGVGLEPFWQALTAGTSAIRRIDRFETGSFGCPFASLLPEGFDVRTLVPKSFRKGTKVMARDIEIAVAGAHMAVQSAGLVTRGTEGATSVTIAPERFGAHIGAGLIAADIDELTAALVTSTTTDGKVDLGAWGSGGMNNLTPLWLLKYLPNMLACHVTIIHDCQGPSNTITCGESSALLSLGESMRVIGRGDADACLSGGAESRVNQMGLMRNWYSGRLRAMPAGAQGPELVRPFDAEACGSVLGEGGGILVVESAESAARRGKAPLAQLAGFGASQSVCADTMGMDLSQSGEDIAAAIESALDDAGMSASEIDAIVPTGCAVPEVDAGERAALERVFGARLATLPIATVVPNAGFCGAGTGALAACAGVQMLATQSIPARLNAAATPGLDAAAAVSRPAALRAVLVLTTSLGGQNAAIILRRAS
ncbi:MAG: putative 3-oxoacyl-[acyl-carrier-protein] synthase [Planctomycetota bacterium]